MKKSKLFRSFYLLAFLAGSLGQVNAAPYGDKGRETEWVQPNGQKLKLRTFGDEYYGRTETTSGYTVVYNPADGAYHYAGVAPDGSNFAPSGTRADLTPPRSLRQHVELEPAKIAAISQARHKKLDGDRAARWAERVAAHRLLEGAQNGAAPDANFKAAAIKAAPVIGDKVGLTILVQFPNDPQTSLRDPVDFPTNKAKIERFCNNSGYSEDGNSGSVYDYYFDQSGGKLRYKQVVTNIITLPNPRAYYNYSDYPKNKVLRGNSGDLLVIDAIAALQAANFNFSPLTVENNKVIATNLFFAGPDSGVWAQGLWPYQTTLAKSINVGTAAKPINISAYQQTNISDSAPVIGTFCHENGHLVFDYSDLYDYGGESQGVGSHCLMGSGNYNNEGRTPSPINAYFKYIMGWANVTTIGSAESIQTALPTTGNVAYRIARPGVPEEYFIVENRGDGDKWADYSIDKGIAIWHIDEAKFGDNEEQMTSAKHYEVSIEQADGKFDLENNQNRGDKNDLFDLTKPIFSDSTKPNAKWWNGASSGVKLRVLSGVGSSTNIQFGQLPADTIVVSNPNGSEVLYAGSTYTIEWEANITGNVKIELFKDGVLYTVLASNQANNGKFVWSLPKNIPVSTGYTIKISSLTNKVPATDSSNLAFEISNATFPIGNVMPYGWFKPKSADKGWKVTKSLAYEGTHCLTNQVIGDGKTAEVAYSSNFKAGKVSFYMKISSEKNFDYARFYIDGVRKTIVKANGTRGMTGTSGWVFASFNLPSGPHTLKWTYEKDDSYLSGKDSVWLDAVSFPETTQEIAVEYPVGTDIKDGETTIHLSDVPAGETSPSQTVTIRNVGKADLTGLQVAKFGANSEDFKVSSLPKTVLAPGKSMTFTVAMTPSDFGLRTASIQILSSDSDESAFNIALDGTGLRAPKLEVYQPADKLLVNGKSKIDFGYATVSSTNNSKIFTLKNAGSDVLNSLAVSVNGANSKDFGASALGVVSLAPGESTTFTVTFSPSAINDRSASIKITSNDKGTGPFTVSLTGTGAPRINASSSIEAASSKSSAMSIVDAVLGQDALTTAAEAPSVTTVEVINGKKYLSLTVAKPVGTEGIVRTVEVSSNLIDWYSGKNHTVTLVNDATTLKVRDKTPTTASSRRYIHLKATQP